MKKIVFAGGCFWGVEEYFSRINGIIITIVGYANGLTLYPSYDDVCSGTTNHVEACAIEYDENIISLEDLLKKFWRIIDPTVLNRQGPDVGSQYRTGIYYICKDDKDLIELSKYKEQLKYKKQIVTEIEQIKCFFVAEEYHQKYLKKNPNGYCHIPLDVNVLIH